MLSQQSSPLEPPRYVNERLLLETCRSSVGRCFVCCFFRKCHVVVFFFEVIWSPGSTVMVLLRLEAACNYAFRKFVFVF